MKKGFTLIELLAVILVLGVIALVAIPVVTEIVAEVKESSIKRSAEGYIEAVGNYIIVSEMTDIAVPNDLSVEDLNLEVKGKLPLKGTIHIENSEVVN